ncbi:hypothetical protein MCOR02_003178 [Pyricularia oryzae]|uniref:Chorismate synthase protein n=1 Tax=Pyricularia grisea TaxID=148305 RepID=A0ABQ8N9G2_PYRGI|nr:hypothetical protein MCOR02_003178 [Pyricularia oryzae]KAI6293490.1 hypothetical protein MCOR33_009102 [Pyricularia grisea]KAI6312475.1 hypothetical protein MCOR34_005591 [Pyricularia oryzae]KAI6363599.1 hypothetical protein MCOR31_007788 [Pyricularia oryzae]KAI6410250.1 hypothetical protein MCOR24_007128 [Pyricularia oryzae]
MVSISWGTIKSLLLFFGPFLLPKMISYYRSLRASSAQSNQPIRPPPPGAQRVIILLCVVAIVFIAKTLPTLSPENVFVLTDSRIQIPTDVLFNRLAHMRRNGSLTATDEALRARFVNLESRLLYLKFGPDALADCPFCVSEEPNTYLYYALPDLLAPHLLNLALLAMATSGLVSGGEGRRWRTVAVMSAAATAAADLYLVNAYDHQSNARALRPADLDMFFWAARRWRHAAFAAMDVVIAGLIWLSSTKRLFTEPPSPLERVEGVTRALASAKSRLSAVSIVKNTASRDSALRARSHAYWAHEVGVMNDVMEDREVVDGVKDALENRIKISAISQDAETYARNVVEAVMPGDEAQKE